MRSMEKRTRSAGTKLTEGEYERLERAAQARGLKLGEWVRQVLLEACEETSRAERAMLEEVLALRTIVLNVMYELAAGEEIDAKRMQELIEKADAEKLSKAVGRLRTER